MLEKIGATLGVESRRWWKYLKTWR